MERKITVAGVLQEGFALGLKNIASLIGAVILWLITIWIPYLNVGTTIAICSIPVELSKGHVISPLFIFDAKYRQYMGEFFTLIGLMMLSLIPAALFMVIPAYIIGIGWSLAIFILLDKGVSPSEALVKSNQATYGYKWTIFFVNLALGIILLVATFIFKLLGDTIGGILSFIAFLLYYPISLGCTATIYKKLFVDGFNVEQSTTQQM
ncbi:hypothetical protein M2132_001232 [Dysgonomonas sp. PH5-45]|uniref:hypothetical protein n=1 Tax=unclassified Dysgonomonas TaxID=2630389 RepID=UPI002475C777|nr:MULTISPECIES: hypothetical protein [unclassified Dysgonomonas]MDH6354897.1 hypothetical protein [Dysgonomonas sp. PH5-45]MDH6387796.1 hypothetical protein [Dysgonomonas sp. PH5-37]